MPSFLEILKAAREKSDKAYDRAKKLEQIHVEKLKREHAERVQFSEDNAENRRSIRQSRKYKGPVAVLGDVPSVRRVLEKLRAVLGTQEGEQ